MARNKRKARKPRAAAAAEPAVDDAPQPQSPLSHLASTVAHVSLSYRPPDASQSDDQPPADSDEKAVSDTDSDAPAPERKRRKKVGKYNRPLTEEERLEVLRLHISEGKTAPAISALFKDKGVTVPVGTIYTVFKRQADGLSVKPKMRHRRNKYTTQDAELVVKAQNENNKWRYDDLRKHWRQANPDRTDAPSNDTIHKWLKAADITDKLLIMVPVARNQPFNIQARKEYCLDAMGWERDRLVFIDETTFSKGLHSSRGRSKRGTLATYVTKNGPGPGMKVCAAVSPVYGLVMYETQLTAYDGNSFALFMQRLCDKPEMKHKSMYFVMDNVALHFTEAVMDAMRALPIHHDIKRLPTYSPHLNPIEYCFHNWKNGIKRIDQLHDNRTLEQQVRDARLVITAHLVSRILDHVFQLYSHCIQELPLEDFKPIGHRVARAQQEAALQRAVIAAGADEKEEKE